MLLFYTFCVDIRRWNQLELKKALKMLVNSIHKNIKTYKIICYTNFKIDDMQEYNIEFRKYYDNMVHKLYNDRWLNLSFNKINIYKDLYDEFKKDFIWIDLDTIICYDISYINKLSNVFIINDGNCAVPKVLFSNNNKIKVAQNKYIQGNFWKLNIDLYNNLMETLKKILSKGLCLRYDLQDLFNYYFHIENKDINILDESMNGLAVWSSKGNTHATLDGLNKLYIDDGILKSKYYPNKEIHILSFTFMTLRKLWYTNNYKKLFD